MAASGDIPELCGLLTILFSQEADFTPDRSKQERGLETIVADPKIGHVYVALVDGKLVGMVSILFTVSTAEGGRAAWLEDMIVHPGWRGRGIGERLLQEAISGARSSGCVRITLLTDSANESATRFYGRSGFARSGMIPLRLAL
jgi:GNAT superfamily N-acetyltransferase